MMFDINRPSPHPTSTAPRQRHTQLAFCFRLWAANGVARVSRERVEVQAGNRAVPVLIVSIYNPACVAHARMHPPSARPHPSPRSSMSSTITLKLWILESGMVNFVPAGAIVLLLRFASNENYFQLNKYWPIACIKVLQHNSEVVLIKPCGTVNRSCSTVSSLWSRGVCLWRSVLCDRHSTHSAHSRLTDSLMAAWRPSRKFLNAP